MQFLDVDVVEEAAAVVGFRLEHFQADVKVFLVTVDYSFGQSKKVKLLAQWIRLRPPSFISCGPGFESQANLQRLFVIYGINTTQLSTLNLSLNGIVKMY